MMADVDAIRHEFKVGRKYTCILSIDAARVQEPGMRINNATGEVQKLAGYGQFFDCRWLPKTPAGDGSVMSRLNKRELRDYLAGRARFMELIMERTGRDFAAVV